jgi:hypothetical protein
MEDGESPSSNRKSGADGKEHLSEMFSLFPAASIITADNGCRGKPHPDIYLTAAKSLGQSRLLLLLEIKRDKLTIRSRRWDCRLSDRGSIGGTEKGTSI